MVFTEAPLEGAYLVEPERRGDDRGFFARVFCERELGEMGLCTELLQYGRGLCLRRCGGTWSSLPSVPRRSRATQPDRLRTLRERLDRIAARG